MISFEKIFLISSLIGLCLYLIQTLMLFCCCDKYIKLQVNLFRVTAVTMVIAAISYVISVFVK